MTSLLYPVTVLLISLSACMVGERTGPETHVIGYYLSWTQASYDHTKIAYDHLTHINHAFVWPNADGSLYVPEDYLYPALVEAAHAAGVRVVLTVGGANHSDRFGTLIRNPQTRARLVSDLVSFCITHDYDGIELDWEFPKATDREFLSQFLQELRATIQTRRPELSLSMALPAIDWEGGYDVEALTTYLDWAGVMTYDFHGPWSAVAGHNAPLYRIATLQEGAVAPSIRYWLDRGIPAHKLILGLPFYGRVFEAPALYSESRGGEPVPYREIEAERSGDWDVRWDAEAIAASLRSPDGRRIVTYDTPRTLNSKLDYILDMGLGGAMIWALGYDHIHDDTQPLLEMVGSQLRIATRQP